jgi:hypothetical protein
MRIAHRPSQKNAGWPSSTHDPGDLNAIVSPGPWRRPELEGRHDVNVRTQPNAGQAVGVRVRCNWPAHTPLARHLIGHRLSGVLQAAVAAGLLFLRSASAMESRSCRLPAWLAARPGEPRAHQPGSHRDGRPPPCHANPGRPQKRPATSTFTAARGRSGLRCSGRANHRDQVRPAHLPGGKPGSGPPPGRKFPAAG